ncbi:putative glycosyltransferase EpsJ [Rubripirellula amarantea]|uniref:Putative glycosyltransferase EpsJ n=1 Tax=Rubripirellula amarantea TaxID=2527999 RepID=A0A5C5WQ87_9BACT|nr:glycosyltransferase [Rubripirellula amarantea]TWT52697.1 putative glycosyltransferase EpsJ [Rubripirellula amarantea]
MTESPSVSLVIPGKNCEKTLGKCLDSVVGLLESGDLSEIIFVNDGSTDNTADIAAKYPITVLTGKGEGPGSARNLGWRHAITDLVWFIDSDCVARRDALQLLLPHLEEDQVAGAGGSYDNLYPNSLLATLIHEEIIARHRRMPSEVNFLATFNVLYRKAVLEQTGGFDENLKLAQDAELAFRICDRGYGLQFTIDSRVGHHHPTRFWKYLKTQCRQGYHRMGLYRLHPEKVRGDSYAGWLDYVQPPLAMLLLVWLTLCKIGQINVELLLIVSMLILSLLLICQVSMTRAILQAPETNRPWYWLAFSFPLFSSQRAMSRGIGMTWGLLRHPSRKRNDHIRGSDTQCESSDQSQSQRKFALNQE